jgi:hypothetical protein
VIKHPDQTTRLILRAAQDNARHQAHGSKNRARRGAAARRPQPPNSSSSGLELRIIAQGQETDHTLGPLEATYAFCVNGDQFRGRATAATRLLLLDEAGSVGRRGA